MTLDFCGAHHQYQTMVDFSEISQHLHVKISPRARRLALRLDTHAGRVNLIVPKRASIYKAYEFAEKNRDWIRGKLAALPRSIDFIDGQIIPVLGTPHTIRITPSPSRATTIALKGDELRVTTQLDDPGPRIARFYKTMANDRLGEMARQKAAQINRTLKTLAIRDMKTRWGSCSIDGRMALSWRLIFAPLIAADYVVAHETAHLVHPNHGEQFWALCQDLSADFNAGHNWMKKNGAELSRYGAPRHPVNHDI